MVRIDVVTSREQLEEAWAIRVEVFVDEQRVPADEEVDDADLAPTTVHVLASDAQGPVGTARLLGPPDDLHIGRVAVRKRARGTGVGQALMGGLEEIAVERYGPVRVGLSAQERVIGFYEGLGYELVPGQRYLDAGIGHRDMVKDLR